MPQSAFIVRPFGCKPVAFGPAQAQKFEALLKRQSECGPESPVVLLAGAEGSTSEVQVNFDAIESLLIQPALREARIRGDTTGAVIEAGNIREDMFNRLITADLVIADLSLHNPNVYYELGLRQAFRDKFTFMIRCDLSTYPFDLQTDRYFDYRLMDLLCRPHEIAAQLSTALRKTLNQYRADSPVFKLMPQLESEDRSRFLSVPEDFREEVERAWRQRQRETLDLLALECEDHLWEIEGLRAVGRAQFEANFIVSAKDTWQRIAARYPDDAEANTVLSTVYQRLQDRTRSEQALARVTRSRTLSPARLSELRALNGRNLKAAWTEHWKGSKQPRVDALRSPLLQRAIDAYVDAFKLDLNNSYAGLNALTLMVIQAELIDGHRDEWRELQRQAADEQREFEQRTMRIDQLAQALLLALESDRERVSGHGQGDPWFAMLEAAVMCMVSRQPAYVAQLYVEARYYAPPKSEAGMLAGLKMYKELGILGVFKNGHRPQQVGTVGENVDAAMVALTTKEREDDAANLPTRLVIFVGLRVDESRRPTVQSTLPRHALDEPVLGAGACDVFPAAAERQTRKLIDAEITEQIERERARGGRLLAIAGGASGGDLIFHEICREKGIPAQMFLPLVKPKHIGEYVAPAGGEWVTRFNDIHRALDASKSEDQNAAQPYQSGVRVFSDSLDLPRWLQDRDHYNIGRRGMLWMLQYAHNLSRNLGANVETTLIALRAPHADHIGAFGGIRHAIRLAQMHGVNVRQIDIPRPGSADQGIGEVSKIASASPDRARGPGPEPRAASAAVNADLPKRPAGPATSTATVAATPARQV